jgi:peptide/nickel transport system substrate-binding protein
MQVAPGVRGYDRALDVRLPYDPAHAKALLSEAGYPDGFAFTFDCTNNRYPGDAEMCAAIAAMWARVGVRASVNAMPVQTFFPKVQRRDTSMFLLGTAPPTLDAGYPIQVSFMSPGGRPGDGAWNLGGYANPAIDALGVKIRSELDPAKRLALMQQALVLGRDDVATIPLYNNQIAWAVRDTVAVTLRADDQMEAKWAVVK